MRIQRPVPAESESKFQIQGLQASEMIEWIAVLAESSADFVHSQLNSARKINGMAPAHGDSGESARCAR